MVKIIKRKTDNKFLQSAETDTWVDDVKYAYEMTLTECVEAKKTLLNTYDPEQIIEIINVLKNKPISKDEKKELLGLLKNKK